VQGRQLSVLACGTIAGVPVPSPGPPVPAPPVAAPEAALDAGADPPDVQAVTASAASMTAASAARREQDMISILPHGLDSFAQYAATRRHRGIRQTGPRSVTFRR